MVKTIITWCLCITINQHIIDVLKNLIFLFFWLSFVFFRDVRNVESLISDFQTKEDVTKVQI